LFTLPAGAASEKPAPAVFTLPPLGYSYDALEPAIDARTMEIHHSRHHQSYVDKLNAEIASDKKLEGKTIEEILGSVSSYDRAVRDNAGGHWNHSFFWGIMSPDAASTKPSADLQAAIEKRFGSMDAFREAFEKEGAARFGSGWVWLVAGKDGSLQIVSTPNQDNPLMDDAEVKGTPLIGNDVWEHAYYLQYQNKRPEYLKAWWSVLDWGKVSGHYAAARR